VRRSNPDARGNVTDVRYFFIRKRGSDRGQELINQDSWWWLKFNTVRASLTTPWKLIRLLQVGPIEGSAA